VSKQLRIFNTNIYLPSEELYKQGGRQPRPGYTDNLLKVLHCCGISRKELDKVLNLTPGATKDWGNMPEGKEQKYRAVPGPVNWGKLIPLADDIMRIQIPPAMHRWSDVVIQDGIGDRKSVAFPKSVFPSDAELLYAVAFLLQDRSQHSRKDRLAPVLKVLGWTTAKFFNKVLFGSEELSDNRRPVATDLLARALCLYEDTSYGDTILYGQQIRKHVLRKDKTEQFPFEAPRGWSAAAILSSTMPFQRLDEAQQPADKPPKQMPKPELPGNPAPPGSFPDAQRRTQGPTLVKDYTDPTLAFLQRRLAECEADLAEAKKTVGYLTPKVAHYKETLREAKEAAEQRDTGT
jgi:hypothetical protein